MRTATRPVPPDLERCQVDRPSTWPRMPSFMTFGPVHYDRCKNKPKWVATDGEGEMSLCDECKTVCEKAYPSGVAYTPIGV